MTSKVTCGGLAYRCLEEHHRRDIWDRLSLPSYIDYEFFRRIQEEGSEYSSSTLHGLLSNAYTIARQLDGCDGDVERAIRAAVAIKAQKSINIASLRRKIYRTANFVVHHVHGILPQPLDIPRFAVRPGRQGAALGTKVFSAADI